jgi:uncharacterized protein YegP (UPF0339 family)
MRKLLVGVMLVVCMVAFSAVTSPVAVAQVKKDKDKKGAKGGHIEIGEGKDGKFRYSVRNAEGKFLAGSAAYATEAEAKKGIEELKEVLKTATVVHKGKTKEK